VCVSQVPSNLEVAISGDFEPEALEAGLLRYLGVMGHGDGQDSSAAPPWKGREEEVFRLDFAAGSKSAVADHIEDDTERAYVLMGFPSVNRWGRLKPSTPGATDIDLVGGKGLQLVPDTLAGGGRYCREMHVSRCMSVANDIISNRLFEEIREKRGLVYSIGYTHVACVCLSLSLSLSVVCVCERGQPAL
jgi:predicted Zn-dependent peptidase